VWGCSGAKHCAASARQRAKRRSQIETAVGGRCRWRVCARCAAAPLCCSAQRGYVLTVGVQARLSTASRDSPFVAVALCIVVLCLVTHPQKSRSASHHDGCRVTAISNTARSICCSGSSGGVREEVLRDTQGGEDATPSTHPLLFRTSARRPPVTLATPAPLQLLQEASYAAQHVGRVCERRLHPTQRAMNAGAILHAACAILLLPT
jgi:hypothetical protein